MAKILVLNGPNLNLLGTREREHYGGDTLDSIIENIIRLASSSGHEVLAYQSNAENQLVDRVQAAASEQVSFIIINPAAFTHTSVALRDALLAVAIPFIEVHLSNIHAREAFRQKSFFSDVARGVIVGLGPIGYELALRATMAYLDGEE